MEGKREREVQIHIKLWTLQAKFKTEKRHLGGNKRRGHFEKDAKQFLMDRE